MLGRVGTLLLLLIGARQLLGQTNQQVFLQAEATFTEAVAREPDSFEANYRLGELYLSVGRIKAGIPYLEKAQRLNASHYASGYDLALAYLETHECTKARAQIRAMLQRQDKAELHNLLGEVEEDAGNHVEAARELQHAAQMDPSEKNIFDWGNELLLHRAYGPAGEIFSHGVQRYPNSAKLLIGLGVALYSRGKYDEAVDALVRSTDLEPSDPKPYLFLGRMFDISLARADEVADRLARFLRLQPKNALANYYYAMATWKGRRTQSTPEALDHVAALLRASASLDPRFSDPHLQLGNLYMNQRKLTEAVREYEQAVKLQPDLAEAHYHLAQAYERLGERDRAQKESALHDRLRKQQQAEDEKNKMRAGQLEFSIEGASKP